MFKEICANFTTFLVCTRADAIDKLVQQDERFTGIAPGRFDGYRTEKEAIGEALREVNLDEKDYSSRLVLITRYKRISVSSMASTINH